jgi:AraC family transcriptional regulator
MNEILSLNRGHYLAQSVNTFEADGLIIGTTAYSKEVLTSQMHYHENSHISFVLSGGNTEKRIGKQIERLPGDIEFYHAGEAHQTIQNKYPSKNIVLEVDQAFLKKNEITEQTIRDAITQNIDGKFLLLKMYRELAAYDSHSATVIHMLFLDLITKTENRKYGKKRPAWVNIVNELMNDKWDEKLTLHDLAIASNVNTITISKHFRKYFFCTFGEYMRKLKIEKSLAYMKTNNLSLIQIAYSCKFADQSHFTRTFKALTGYLPKQYHKL